MIRARCLRLSAACREWWRTTLERTGKSTCTDRPRLGRTRRWRGLGVNREAGARREVTMGIGGRREEGGEGGSDEGCGRTKGTRREIGRLGERG
eukprot:311789-Rhodomonas_salina.2